MTFEESMTMLGEEILRKIGIVSASDYMTSATYPVTGKPRIITGGLRDSILGGIGSIRKIEVGSDKATFTIGTTLPYAALIAKGGVRVVTEKMRKFFWHKYFTETGAAKDMWARLRFKNLIRYLPRPFLEPAAEEVVQTELPKLLSKYTMQYLRASVQEIIVGTPRADVYNAPYQGLSPL